MTTDIKKHVADAAMRVGKAKSEIVDAEAQLGEVISALEVLARSQKVAASQAVDDAFEKLRAARARLDELEVLLRQV